MNFLEIHEQATAAAEAAADAAIAREGDTGACGFAWVNFYVDGRTRIGKELKRLPRVRRSYDGGLQLWNPSQAPVQSVYVLERGAEAYAKKFRELTGLDSVYAGSRLD
jgi:hypothetical protein